jgi:hypothetical protein
MIERMTVGNARGAVTSVAPHAVYRLSARRHAMPDHQTSAAIGKARAVALWDFYNNRHLFDSSHAAVPIFCFDVTRRH